MFYADLELARSASLETNSKETLTKLAENEKVKLSCDEVEPDASMDEASSIEPTLDKEMIDEPPQGELQELEDRRTKEAAVPGSLSALATRSSTTHDTAGTSGDPAMNGAEEAEEDVAMEEDDTSSEEEDTDDYEPTHVGVRLPDPQSPVSRHSSPPHAPLDHGVLETSDTDMQGMASTTPINQPISLGDGDTESETHREVDKLGLFWVAKLTPYRLRSKRHRELVRKSTKPHSSHMRRPFNTLGLIAFILSTAARWPGGYAL